jgi:hypothetical protein
VLYLVFNEGYSGVSTPKQPNRRPASSNATTSRGRPHGSTRSFAVEHWAVGSH